MLNGMQQRSTQVNLSNRIINIARNSGVPLQSINPSLLAMLPINPGVRHLALQ